MICLVQVTWRSRQKGVVRYNCADSLDRTNAASYFAAVQVRACPCCSCLDAGCDPCSSSYPGSNVPPNVSRAYLVPEPSEALLGLLTI